MVKCGVLFEVRTEYLNIIRWALKSQFCPQGNHKEIVQATQVFGSRFETGTFWTDSDVHVHLKTGF
jgi:hypothetical protein